MLHTIHGDSTQAKLEDTRPFAEAHAAAAGIEHQRLTQAAIMPGDQLSHLYKITEAVK